jgi:hypothetical protein
MPDALALLAVEAEASEQLEARLIAMVLDSVTSLHSRRSYEKGLRLFFAWCREQSREQAREQSFDRPQPGFSKALANAYRSWLLAQGLAPSTINLRLSPIRKLADNHLLAPTRRRLNVSRASSRKACAPETGCSKSRPASCLTPRPSRASATGPCSRCWSAAACAALLLSSVSALLLRGRQTLQSPSMQS